MFFSEDTLKRAWERAGGKCEALRIVDGKKTACCSDLQWEKHGQLHEPDGWVGSQRLRLEHGIIDVAANCEIVCRECYHQIGPESPAMAN